MTNKILKFGSLTLVSFILTYSVSAQAQGADYDTICANFSENYSDSLDSKSRMLLYRKHVEPYVNGSEGNSEPISLDSLIAKCKPFQRYYNGLLKATPVAVSEEKKGFFDTQNDEPWKKSELKEETAKCAAMGGSKSVSNRDCKKACEKLSEHISYKSYSNLTEYQKGRLLGMALSHNMTDD